MVKTKRAQSTRSNGAHGQALVEFALMLPLLVLLILGIIEIGMSLYSYLSLATANREGVRLASRARFTDDAAAGLVASSGGLTEEPDGTLRSDMKLLGEDANLAVIITHISVDTDGTLLSVTTYVTGTIVDADNVPRPVSVEDTRFTDENLLELVQNSLSATSEINTYREAMLYDTIPDDLVVIESFLAHHMVTPIIRPVRSTITLYFHSVMRVMRDSRDTIGGD
jgi:Flp pilus assembly protein TadG